MTRTAQRSVAALAGRSDAARLAAIERLQAAGSLPAMKAVAHALDDPSIAVRRAAADCLASSDQPEVGGLLIDVLRESHLDTLIAASIVQVLARTSRPVTGSLVALLAEPDQNLRVQTALALGLRGDQRAIPALEGALADEHDNVRTQAIESLGLLRSRSSAPKLAAIARSGEFGLAFHAVAALAHIGDTSVVTELQALLERSELLSAVVPALGRLGDAHTVVALLRVLQERRARPDMIASALAQICRRHPDAYAVLRDQRHAQTLTVLTSAVETAGMSELPDLVDLFGQLEGAAAIDALTAILRRNSTEHSEEQEAPERGAQRLDSAAAAARALGRKRATAAVPAIGEALAAQEGSPAVQMIRALADIGAPAAVEVLWPRLGDADAAVREAAVAAIRTLGGVERARVEALLAHADPVWRCAGVELLPAEESSIPLLLVACDDPELIVRRVALSCLASMDDARASGRLACALADPDASVRAAAARALGSDGVRHAALLLRALDDASPWVRVYALRALAAADGALPDAILIGLAFDDPAPFVRIAAIEGLARRSTREARATLATIAGAGQPELSAAAARALDCRSGGMQ